MLAIGSLNICLQLFSITVAELNNSLYILMAALWLVIWFFQYHDGVQMCFPVRKDLKGHYSIREAVKDGKSLLADCTEPY